MLTFFIGIFLLLSMSASTFNTATSTSTFNTITSTMKQRMLPVESMEGKILYTTIYSFDTNLIDSNGNIINTWYSNSLPGLSAYYLPNGDILRPKRLNLEQGGAGGIQQISFNSDIIWDYTYQSLGQYSTHHDIEPLPNGNVLSLSWVFLSYLECVELGCNPSNVPAEGWRLEKIIEIKPTGPTSGEIVWSWCSIDHLIQDYDPTKANYGDVSNHPELIDINYEITGEEKNDLFHCNSIDYNPETDQIIVSCRNYNEVWVISHCNGTLLNRWGNPATYRSTGERQLFEQHCSIWIPSDYPGGGHILIFNNGVGRGYSSVDEVDLSTGNIVWSYTHQNFYSMRFSNAIRLKSGNTLICHGESGNFFEVTPEKNIVWSYSVPVQGGVYRIEYVLPEGHIDCIGSLNWNKIKVNTTVSGQFEIRNTDNESLYWEIESYPNWGVWNFSAMSGSNNATIQVTVKAPDIQNKAFEGFVKVVNSYNEEDWDVVPVVLKTSLVLSFKKTKMNSEIFPVSEIPILTKFQLRQMYLIGFILSKIIGRSWM
jgi:hypothetical protein